MIEARSNTASRNFNIPDLNNVGDSALHIAGRGFRMSNQAIAEIARWMNRNDGSVLTDAGSAIAAAAAAE
jgi:hypothetical protein